jgi:RimJ/RimL family protein N-acetyltransferase
MLVGERVVLRTVRERDLDQLYDLMADVRTMGDFWPLISTSTNWATASIGPRTGGRGT